MNKKEVFNAIQNGAKGKLKNRTDMATVVKSDSDTPSVDLYIDGKFQKRYTEREFMKASMFAAKGIVLENLEVEISDSKEEVKNLKQEMGSTAEKQNTESQKDMDLKDAEKKVEVSKVENSKAKSSKPEVSKQKSESVKVSKTETSKTEISETETSKLDWKIKDDKLCIVGNYEKFYTKKSGFDKSSPIRLFGQWEDIKVGKDKISAKAEGDDCEFWYDGELIYRKCEKMTVHWNCVNEVHDGTVTFKIVNEGIYVSAQDNKAHIVFEEGTVNAEKSLKIKRELMDRNYNITDYSLL